MTARTEKEKEQMCRRKGDFALQREHSHNSVLYVCVLYVRVCECACCASAKPTHPQAVDLHILFGLSVCPNIVHPTSPPANPPHLHQPLLSFSDWPAGGRGQPRDWVQSTEQKPLL